MANFRTHVTFSSVLGCGYAAAGYALGLPPETALVGGGLCGLSGMLPDIDSDTGVPLREAMALAAALAPALLYDRLRSLALPHDQMVLLAAGIYFCVRFGVTKLIAGRTSHRGMFHSIPAALIFAGIAFLLCKGSDVTIAYFKAGGVFLGAMSHLVLDEIYSFEVKRGRVRVKRSFGTALKFWGKDAYSNFSTYTKLAIVAALILGEPAVMDRLQGRAPTLAIALERLSQRYFHGSDLGATSAFQESLPPHTAAAPTAPGVGPFPNGPQVPPTGENIVAPGYFQPGVNYFEAHADRPPHAPRW